MQEQLSSLKWNKNGKQTKMKNKIYHYSFEKMKNEEKATCRHTELGKNGTENARGLAMGSMCRSLYRTDDGMHLDKLRRGRKRTGRPSQQLS